MAHGKLMPNSHDRQDAQGGMGTTEIVGYNNPIHFFFFWL